MQKQLVFLFIMSIFSSNALAKSENIMNVFKKQEEIASWESAYKKDSAEQINQQRNPFVLTAGKTSIVTSNGDLFCNSTNDGQINQLNDGSFRVCDANSNAFKEVKKVESNEDDVVNTCTAQTNKYTYVYIPREYVTENDQVKTDEYYSGKAISIIKEKRKMKYGSFYKSFKEVNKFKYYIPALTYDESIKSGGISYTKAFSNDLIEVYVKAKCNFNNTFTVLAIDVIELNDLYAMSKP